jgi:hypothetical protein
MKRILVALLALALLGAPLAALAAPPALPSTGTAIYTLTFHLSGQWAAATKTGIITFTAPSAMRVLYVQAVAAAKGGTQGTSTLTCNNAGSAVTNAMDLTGTAGTVIEATLVAAQQSIAGGNKVTCDLVISGGSSPTLDNITVGITYQRQ